MKPVADLEPVAAERERLAVDGLGLALLGRPASLIRHVTDRPSHDRRYALDGSKVRALGWTPRVAFDDDLAGTVEWYPDNESWWGPIRDGSFADYYRRLYAERLATSSAAP